MLRIEPITGSLDQKKVSFLTHTVRGSFVAVHGLVRQTAHALLYECRYVLSRGDHCLSQPCPRSFLPSARRHAQPHDKALTTCLGVWQINRKPLLGMLEHQATVTDADAVQIPVQPLDYFVEASLELEKIKGCKRRHAAQWI